MGHQDRVQEDVKVLLFNPIVVVLVTWGCVAVAEPRAR